MAYLCLANMHRKKCNIQNGLIILVLIQFLIIISFVGKRHNNANYNNYTLFPSRFFGAVQNISNGRYSVNESSFAGFPSEKPSFIRWKNSLNDLSEKSSTHRIVYQVLTGDTVTFRNYLSILSVFKFLKPFRIILFIHKKFNPKLYEYNKWYQRAAAQIPCLEVVHLDRIDRIRDPFDTVTELRFVLSEIKQEGGVYVNLNTIINWDPWKTPSEEVQIGIVANSSIGFISVAKNASIVDMIKNISTAVSVLKQNISNCVFSYEFTGTEPCCLIRREIYPIDIMRQNSSFGSLARFLFYGNSDILEPQNTFPPIPKIVHYIWLGNKHISFSMYLSFLSTLRFVKPSQIIIYVDSFDLGNYFDEIKKSSVVSIVYYGTPMTVFQRRIANPLHMSDFVRTDILLRFGGIYMDWDVFWLKPIDDLLALGYETIAAFDHFKGMGRNEFPDTINMGVLLARPGSRFISLWQDTFHDYTGQHPTFHAVEMVYKTYEEHPDLLFIEKRLQVMCFWFRCHPLWLPNYQEERVHNKFDFTREAYSVHFTDPIPKEFSSENSLKTSKGFFGDMARHVFGIT